MAPPGFVKRFGSAALFAIVALVVFTPVFVLGPILPGRSATLIELGLSIGLWLVARKAAPDGWVASLAPPLLAAAISLLVVSLVDVEALGVRLDSPAGLATAKLIDASVIVAALLITSRWQRRKLADLYLRRGRLALGIGVGLACSVAIVILGRGKPGNEAMLDTLRAYPGSVAVFVVANALMEELLFRGLFIGRLQQRVGSTLAVAATSVVFALAHVGIQYQSPEAIGGFLAMVLLLGVLWGAMMLATRSILASVLFHIGADIVIVSEVFRSFGALR